MAANLAVTRVPGLGKIAMRARGRRHAWRLFVLRRAEPLKSRLPVRRTGRPEMARPEVPEPRVFRRRRTTGGSRPRSAPRMRSVPRGAIPAAPAPAPASRVFAGPVAAALRRSHVGTTARSAGRAAFRCAYRARWAGSILPRGGGRHSLSSSPRDNRRKSPPRAGACRGEIRANRSRTAAPQQRRRFPTSGDRRRGDP